MPTALDSPFNSYSVAFAPFSVIYDRSLMLIMEHKMHQGLPIDDPYEEDEDGFDAED